MRHLLPMPGRALVALALLLAVLGGVGCVTRVERHPMEPSLKGAWSPFNQPPVTEAPAAQVPAAQVPAAAPAPVPGPPTGKAPTQVALDQLEDFALKADGLAVNNFCLSENEDGTALHLRATYRNRQPEARAVCVMVVGLSEAKDILWAGHATCVADPNGVGVLPELNVLVPAGTLKQTAAVSLRLNARKDVPVQATTYRVPLR